MQFPSGKNKPSRFWVSANYFALQTQIHNKLIEELSLQKALGPKLKQETILLNGLNDSSHATVLFKEYDGAAPLLQQIGTRQARDARADHDNTSGLGGDVNVGSESLGKERATAQPLLFKIRIKFHRDISNENSPQVSYADFIFLQLYQTVCSVLAKPRKLCREI